MKRLITLFIALALVGIVQAEEKTLQGTVIDQDGKPIEGANVVLTRQYYDEIIEINSTSDETGAFSITYNADYTFELNVSAEGYTGYYSSFPAEVQGALQVYFLAGRLDLAGLVEVGFQCRIFGIGFFNLDQYVRISIRSKCSRSKGKSRNN